MRYPLLYQKNTRLWLAEISELTGSQATLDDIRDDEIARLAALGFDWLYLICMWDSGKEEAQIARAQPGLQREAQLVLGGGGADSLCSSCFAISGYRPPEIWGGRPALARLRDRLHQHGLRLMLDFIPNHTGISHPWARDHPEYYFENSLNFEANSQITYQTVETVHGRRVLAHGRDPHFPAWIDTLQLNYGRKEVQEAMFNELINLAEVCDGLRCDMAMLIMPEVFQKTWGVQADAFWPWALAKVRETHPEFTFLAEVYWGLESELLAQGFDFTYDKELYDRLVERKASRVREQILAEKRWVERQAHFLENHDEKRAAAVFEPEVHRAAAVISYLLPGLRFFQAGQESGNKLRPPVQFCRPPSEAGDPAISDFYSRFLEKLKQVDWQGSSWRLTPASPAWEGDQSWENFVVFDWDDGAGKHWLAAINYSNQRSYCYVRPGFDGLHGRRYRLHDLLNSLTYDRSGDELVVKGLFLDRHPWGYHLFAFEELD